MKKELEEQLNDNIQEILSVIFSYLNEIDKINLVNIYFYASEETEGGYYSDVFFKFKKNFLRMSDIKYRDFDDIVEFYEFHRAFIKKNRNICITHKTKVPTQIKIDYNIKTEQIKYNFEYDLFYSNIEYGLPNYVADEWFNELKTELEKDN